MHYQLHFYTRLTPRPSDIIVLLEFPFQVQVRNTVGSA